MNKETNWQDIGYILSSTYRKKVLEAVKSPKMPSKISKELNLNIAHISRALTELEDRKLVRCLTPDSNKGKLYLITDHGSEILNSSEKI